MRNAPDSIDEDLTLLLSAVRAGDADTVAAILGRRPGLLNAHGPEGQTPLHVAAECNDARIGALLVAAGADLQAKFGGSGHTPLSWAVTCHAMDFAKTMTRLGAKPDLFCAAGIGAIDAVEKWFDASGALRPEASHTGSSRFAADGTRLACPPETAREQISDALYMAARNGHANVVRFLLTKSPDLAFRAYLGGTPLHWAYFGGSQEVVELLIGAGADPAARDDAIGVLPRAFGICTLAGWGFGFLVRERLNQDPSLALIKDVTTPLHEAAREGHTDVVEMLLAAGADPNAVNRDGRTPAQLASAHGHGQVLAALRRASAPDTR